MKVKLLKTGDCFIAEASPQDYLWGIGMYENDRNINIPSEWKGVNILGWALMTIRDELQS